MLKEAINYILKLWRIFVLRRQFNEIRAVGFYERLYQPHFRINGLLCISNVFLCITRMEYLHSIIIIYRFGVYEQHYIYIYIVERQRMNFRT